MNEDMNVTQIVHVEHDMIHDLLSLSSSNAEFTEPIFSIFTNLARGRPGSTQPLAVNLGDFSAVLKAKFLVSGGHFLVRHRAVRADRPGGGGPGPPAQDRLLRRRLPLLQQPPRRPRGALV